MPPRDRCLQGIETPKGSVPSGDRCLHGIGDFRGSVTSGDRSAQGIGAPLQVGALCCSHNFIINSRIPLATN